MLRRASVVVVLALLVSLVPVQAQAHAGLKTGAYECWLTQIGQYSNYELKIRSGNRYALMLDDDVVGKAGEFTHSGQKVTFTSGYLKKKGYKGKHAVLEDGTRMVYLYKNGEMVYDCNNN